MTKENLGLILVLMLHLWWVIPLVLIIAYWENTSQWIVGIITLIIFIALIEGILNFLNSFRGKNILKEKELQLKERELEIRQQELNKHAHIRQKKIYKDTINKKEEEKNKRLLEKFEDHIRTLTPDELIKLKREAPLSVKGIIDGMEKNI